MISYNFFHIAPLLNFTAFGDFDNQIETSMQSIVHLYKHHENERESQKRLLCDPDLIHNYFLLLKRMFDFFNNRNKCHKPGFLRGNIYTSCISMVLLDHFANKSNTFQHSLSLPLSLSVSLPLSLSLSLSHFLLGSPLPPIPDSRIAQLKVPCRPLNQRG